jgi:Xaa-Pro aminopeptidase
MKETEFAKRRRRLMQEMDGGIAIIATNPVHRRNRDTEFRFRPDSDFYYLTGFPEPDAVAVLIPHRSEGEFILFCRDRDPERETWDGRRAGPQGALERFGADQAYPIEELDARLPELLVNREKVFYAMGNRAEFDNRVIGWLNEVKAMVRTGVHAPVEIVDVSHVTHEMRLFKSREEIRTMKRAAKIAAQAHKRAMRRTQPGMMEYQVEAELLHEFMTAGAPAPAYTSIVGGGGNGCILHYVENDQPLADGDLLLIDAGAEYDYYASDITRTFPVNGRFSAAQRQLYEVVLAAQLAAIAQVKPGNHWNDPHEAAVRVITEGLVDLGILKGNPDTLIEDLEYRRFYMHRTGHWLGMDVHDVGDYKVDDTWRLLEPGMVLTVEPGIYIPAGSRGVRKKWWNIGIRVEDDVVVTRDGCDILTKDVPKTVEAIEALMRQE